MSQRASTLLSPTTSPPTPLQQSKVTLLVAYQIKGMPLANYFLNKRGAFSLSLNVFTNAWVLLYS
jgi:hypothetical protein